MTEASGGVSASSVSVQPIRPGLVEKIEAERDGLPRPKCHLGAMYTSFGPKPAIVIPAPKVMSISNNRDEFLGLIYEYHRRVYATARTERKGFRGASIDLAPVRQLSLDAALVLTAEYHRRITISGYKPLIDDNHWDPNVRMLFEQLGMYTLVEAIGRTAHRSASSTQQGTLRFVQFHSGTKVEQQEARKLIDSLRDAAGHEPEREYVYAALVEAIKNVKHHAYPDDEGLDVRVPTISKWWAAGAFDTQEQVLQFVVYDQGVGIPATLPRQTFFRAVRRLCPPEWNDADVIEGGIRYGRTRFRSGSRPESERSKVDGSDRKAEVLSGRGNGLWAICHFIPQLAGSSVRIVSGRGEVVYSGGRAVTKTQYKNAFCGTLIEWTLKLPSKQAPAKEAA